MAQAVPDIDVLGTAICAVSRGLRGPSCGLHADFWWTPGNSVAGDGRLTPLLTCEAFVEMSGHYSKHFEALKALVDSGAA
jgi:hypothetical protein